MEHRLLSAADHQNPELSPKTTDSVLSLITNPFTSESSLSSLIETLILHLQNPDSDHNKILSLLYAISDHHPRLHHRVSSACHAFILLPSAPPPTLPHALSLVESDHSTPPEPFLDESLFLSLCFWPCVKTRRWVLLNVSKFRVRPSVLLTVLLGLTKDPYPYIREVALDGLVMLSEGIVLEDQSLIGGCYFRAVELLFDLENTVRCSAVRAVSEWGKLLVRLNTGETKKDLSDALFVQLCLMIRDTDMEIRVAAFDALGQIQTVSEDILLQTFSKKVFPAIKERSYPGQYTAKLFKLPATAAAFAFVHGLEDEFYQVRKSACHALQMLSALSAEFSGRAVHILMDMLNDDSVVVRFQVLETLHHMAVHDFFTVEESHLDMILGTLVDNDILIRSAARKTLQFFKLQTAPMFRSCIGSLVKNLELYPQDEADLFNTLYKIGRAHGKFVISIIKKFLQELEPTFDGHLDFNKARTAALLVLAISAPVSLERNICSIPPQIFSYAVMLVDRLSCGLDDVMDQDTILAYLSHCSRLTFASAENFEEQKPVSYPSMKLTKVITPLHHYLLDPPVKEASCTEIVFREVVNLWPLIQLGCMNEVIRTLRSWKKELRNSTHDSRQPDGLLMFALEYLHVIKLLGKAWICYFSIKNLQSKGMGVLEGLLIKTERRLNEMLNRFVGLSREESLHILELMLVTSALKFSSGGICCYEENKNKLRFVLSRVESLRKEGSLELSDFVTDLQNISCEIGSSEDGSFNESHLLQKSLNLFSLKHIVLSRKLMYRDAGLDVCSNDLENPLPFISGLPVGIPVDITLYNISSETRLWLAITLGKSSTQFVFLDLHGLGGCNEMRKFTYVAPFYKTPKVKYFSVKVSIAMECLSKNHHPIKHCNRPKHELVHLCKGREVHLSTTVK